MFKALFVVLSLGFVLAGLSPQTAEIDPALKSSAPKSTILAMESIKKLGINVSVKNYKRSYASILNQCAELSKKTLLNLPQEHVSKLKKLVFTFDQAARRGLGGGDTIVLRCINVEQREVVSVLTHEVGHIVDSSVLTGSLFGSNSGFIDGQEHIKTDDKSSDFYAISFSDEDTRAPGSRNADFISGYANSNPFEDFAESYNYYILHGDEFRELAQENSKISQKYDFLKTVVFNNYEYENGEIGNLLDNDQRPYDSTILAYNLDKFFTKKS